MAQSGHFVKTDEANFDTLVLKGQAHFLGLYPNGQLDYRIVRSGVDDPTVKLIKGLLYTWVGGEDETTVLTTSRPGFKTTPQYNVRPWSEFVSDKRIPSMYWRRLRALSEFLKTPN